MKKFLIWVLSSTVLMGCVIQEEKKVPVRNIMLPAVEKRQKDISFEKEKVFGKIEIEGVLNQTFVHSEDNRQLVYHDLDGNPVDAGPNFLDYRCTQDSQNLIVYGHSSRTSDILFTPLARYLDDDFAQNHTEINVEVFGKKMVFQLISVFLFHVEEPSDNDWMQTDFHKEFLYHQAVQRMKKRSLTDFEGKTGSSLLTLVTCNPSNSKQRIILVGIRDEIDGIMKSNKENEHEQTE